eukprot:UN07746
MYDMIYSNISIIH